MHCWHVPFTACAVAAAPADPLRVAVGSFLETYTNKVRVINAADGAIACEFDHPFPPTRLQWAPLGARSNVLASTADLLRIWDGASGKQKAVLTNLKSGESAAPLTSFDWNPVHHHVVGTASIDTTCTVWDIEKGQAQTQLIAHDREVFDMSFSNGPDTFASVGADGSLRMFDLRNLEHSTILFETADNSPLLRVAWNRKDPNYIATFAMDSSTVVVIDVREPSQSVVEAIAHTLPVNSLAWDPHAMMRLCTAADDGMVHVWDVGALLKSPSSAPVVSSRMEGPINQIAWAPTHNDTLAVTCDDSVRIVRMRS